MPFAEGKKPMEKRAVGTVISVKKQWWLKVNTKSVRLGPTDGALFPHIIKASYQADGKEYTKRKWIGATEIPPRLGDSVTVVYDEDRPQKGKILL